MAEVGRCCSLIPGLSAKLSTTIPARPTVLSAVGACPPHDGVRWRINVESAVALSSARQASSDLTTATVPAGRHFPPCGGNSVISYARYAAAFFVDHSNSIPSIHMRCRITASLRATATLALRSPLRLASLISATHFGTRVSNTLAATLLHLRSVHEISSARLDTRCHNRLQTRAEHFEIADFRNKICLQRLPRAVPARASR